ncbi:MAG: dynamin family protein [Rhodobacteraceae bacterium]|nr:dynamin family protein [Paracoccaceae bacterium]
MDDASFEPQAVYEVPDEPAAAHQANAEPRMPCIALMGEFSAGKTTLINFLLGEDMLPTRITATQLPPVWMSYGEPAAYYVDVDGDQRELDLDDLHSVPVEGVKYIKVHCEADILKHMDLIDTPGISDPNIPDSYRAAIVDYVDAVIWCTHATQAWRESERSVWMTIPEALQANSILLATRADKLGERDRARVLHRLNREIGDRFRQIIMFSATDAIRACQIEDETGLLEASGGASLVATLQDISAEIAAASGLASPANEPEYVEPAAAVTPVRPTRVSVVRSTRVPRPDSADEGMMADDTGFDAASNDDRTDADANLSDRDMAHEAAFDEGYDAAAAEYEDGTSDDADDDFEPQTAASTDEDYEEEEDVGPEVISAIAADAMDQDTSEVETEAADDDASLSGVLDLSKYEVSRPAPVEAPAEEVDATDIAEFMAQTQTEEDSSEADIADEDDVEVLEADDMAEPDETAEVEAEAEEVEPISARAIWDDILNANPVQTVPELAAAFGQFVTALEEHGLILAAQLPAVDMAAERGDTSGWRMLGQ